MKSEILKLRKKIFKNLKTRAFSYEAPNAELEQYQKDQDHFSKRAFRVTDMETLSRKVLSSDIIYLGDFHTFDQNIRNVLRIVKILVSQDTNCILGLEMIASGHQFYIDAYLERHLTDLEFLECINYHNSWRFPWSHYKLIFDLAKKHNLKVIGLNTQGSLKERDEFAAQQLQKTAQLNPQAKLLVLYGELHITTNKIPSLMKRISPKSTYTIIHQNLDEVYWKLIKQEQEQGIVSFNKNEFCIISAPPWIKYESMIYWYENLIDDPDFDIHEYIIETGAKIFVDDTKESFLNICNELTSHLELDIPKDHAENFNLYDHTHLEFIEQTLEENLTPTLFSFYKYLMTTNKSFRFPNSSTFYCSSYSMNRISYLAGIHILHYFLEENQINTFEILSSKSSQKKFIVFCYQAATAYFFSKIINPHRKCDMYQDLVKKDDCKHSLLAAKVLNNFPMTPLLAGIKVQDFYESSLLVGHILGEYLYRKANNTEDRTTVDLSFHNISEKEFNKFKENLLFGIQFKQHSKRYF